MIEIGHSGEVLVFVDKEEREVVISTLQGGLLNTVRLKKPYVEALIALLQSAQAFSDILELGEG